MFTVSKGRDRRNQKTYPAIESSGSQKIVLAGSNIAALAFLATSAAFLIGQLPSLADVIVVEKDGIEKPTRSPSEELALCIKTLSQFSEERLILRAYEYKENTWTLGGHYRFNQPQHISDSQMELAGLSKDKDYWKGEQSSVTILLPSQISKSDIMSMCLERTQTTSVDSEPRGVGLEGESLEPIGISEFQSEDFGTNP